MQESRLISRINPNKIPCTVHCGQSHAQISDGQHGQEVEHGLVQARFSPDYIEHQAVTQKNNSINGGEENRNPGILLLQTRKSSKKEGGGVHVRAY